MSASTCLRPHIMLICYCGGGVVVSIVVVCCCYCCCCLAETLVMLTDVDRRGAAESECARVVVSLWWDTKDAGKEGGSCGMCMLVNLRIVLVFFRG